MQNTNEPDRPLAEIAHYVATFSVGEKSLNAARLCLADAIACALEALDQPDCTRLLGPLVPGVWFGLRGFNKVEQRALTTPYGLWVQGLMVAWLLFGGLASRAAIEGLAVATPIMLAASYLGLRLFDRLSTSTFQRSVVVLAIGGAIVLVARQL